MRPLALLLLAACSSPGAVRPSDYLNPMSDQYAPDVASHAHAELHQAFLDDLVDRGLTGISVALRDDGGTWTGASGQADQEVGAPMAATSVSHVGSVSKVYAAVLTMRLTEDGVIDLDERLDEALPAYAPQVPEAGRITVADLMRHSSGIPSYAENPSYLFPSIQGQVQDWTPEELLALSASLPRPIEPGEGFSYSNTNYLLLQLIAEERAGRSFEDLLREEISEPLGLASTFAPGETSHGVRVIPGYVDFYGDGWLVPTAGIEIGLGYADGGITSTCGEMAIFVEAIFGSEELLTQDAVARMAEPWWSEEDDGYGLGLAMRRHGETWLHGHDGANLGYRAMLWHDPVASRTLVVLVNSGGGTIDAILEEGFDLTTSEMVRRVFG